MAKITFSINLFSSFQILIHFFKKKYNIKMKNLVAAFFVLPSIYWDDKQMYFYIIWKGHHCDTGVNELYIIVELLEIWQFMWIGSFSQIT